MDLIGALMQLWNGVNGGKLNIGAVTVLLTFGIQKALPSLGLDHDQATIMATTLVQAAGYVVLIIGAVHKIIKGIAAKNQKRLATL